MGLQGHWPKERHEIGVNENLLKTFITRLNVVLVTIVISLFHFIHRSHMCKDYVAKAMHPIQLLTNTSQYTTI